MLAMSSFKSIDIVLPCYNEEEALPPFFRELKTTCQAIKADIHWNVILIDDGSNDETFGISKKVLSLNSDWLSSELISFSRNFGKESAIMAGLDHSSADACIIMDADLQDPPAVIESLINSWIAGSTIVCAVRRDRSEDDCIKKITAKLFYFIFGKLTRSKSPLNIGDFRLLDSAAVSALRDCRECNRFSKGLFYWIGFEQSYVYYKRPNRIKGSSKWSYWKLWNYALDGLFGFSTIPLRVWTYVGTFVTLCSFSIGLASVVRVIIYGVEVPGYASVFALLSFLGGLQLIGMGVIGEYIGRIHLESKNRPLYICKYIKKFSIQVVPGKSRNGRKR